MSIARARSLRSSATQSENALWDVLRRRQQWGLRFRRQHRIGPFVVDFVCLERRLVVEVDGAVHDHARRQDADIERDAWLAGQHFEIVRIPSGIAAEDPAAALALIAAALGPATVAGVVPPHPRPFPRNGGREKRDNAIAADAITVERPTVAASATCAGIADAEQPARACGDAATRPAGSPDAGDHRPPFPRAVEGPGMGGAHLVRHDADRMDEQRQRCFQENDEVEGLDR